MKRVGTLVFMLCFACAVAESSTIVSPMDNWTIGINGAGRIRGNDLTVSSLPQESGYPLRCGCLLFDTAQFPTAFTSCEL
jgi:hypothetical protein